MSVPNSITELLRYETSGFFLKFVLRDPMRHECALIASCKELCPNNSSYDP